MDSHRPHRSRDFGSGDQYCGGFVCWGGLEVDFGQDDVKGGKLARSRWWRVCIVLCSVYRRLERSAGAGGVLSPFGLALDPIHFLHASVDLRVRAFAVVVQLRSELSLLAARICARVSQAPERSVRCALPTRFANNMETSTLIEKPMMTV